MPSVIGIDLGTTNSVVAAVKEGQARVLADDHGQVLVPSAITLGENDRLWFGREAAALGAAAPGRTAHAIKRLMGRRFSDPVVQRARQMYPYHILENQGGGVLVQLGERQFTPEELSGLLLRHLVEHASRRLGDAINEAVITVPAYFNHAQREATQAAAFHAGLSVLRLLNEPTAAALSLQLDPKEETVVAVYDFGGGTFDFSIIRIHASVYEVLATNGDTFLGGDDIDALLCDELSAKFQQESGVLLRDFPLSWHRLRDAAEQAKKELSQGARCAVFLPRLVGEHSLTTELERSRLEEMARPLIDRSLEICNRTLAQAGLERKDVDRLVLVGGQTRMPLLRKMVEEFFGRAPQANVNPDTVVAEGAAREAATLKSGGGVLLLDVTPITLGINIAGNRLFPIIPRNTKIPVRREHLFTTHRDAQTRARMVILQGDEKLASENTRLGEVVLERLRGERFQPRIRVAFEVDASGILHVKAIDQDTGEEHEVIISDSFGEAGRQRAGELPDAESVAVRADTVPAISGAFRETELWDVLCFLHVNRKTGELQIGSGGKSGGLWLQQGEITHARLEERRGLEAFREIRILREGSYAFREGLTESQPPEIREPFEDLLR
ncbi:MAG: Hsp70 family protein [Myxococcales bacterium]|nr:Hsp70 family protein [Myxococcales bacterium]